MRLRPGRRPHWKSLQRSLRPLAGFQRAAFERKGEGEGRRVRGGEGRELVHSPTSFLNLTPVLNQLVEQPITGLDRSSDENRSQKWSKNRFKIRDRCQKWSEFFSKRKVWCVEIRRKGCGFALQSSSRIKFCLTLDLRFDLRTKRVFLADPKR